MVRKMVERGVDRRGENEVVIQVPNRLAYPCFHGELCHHDRDRMFWLFGTEEPKSRI